MMEMEVLKKKLSSFRGEGGRVTNVTDDLLLEILSAWENWTGSARDFYRGIGSNQKKMARMIGKAKQLRREGCNLPFEELKLDAAPNRGSSHSKNCGIEVYDKNKVIKFSKVDLLVEYLKKAS